MTRDSGNDGPTSEDEHVDDTANELEVPNFSETADGLRERTRREPGYDPYDSITTRSKIIRE